MSDYSVHQRFYHSDWSARRCGQMGVRMKNRKNYLRARRRKRKWTQLGYISPNGICPLCGEKALIQFDQYDAWACMSCMEWLDEACGDPECPYCSIRPSTPYDAYILNDTDAGIKKRWRCDNYQHKIHGMIKHETRRQKQLLWEESHERHFSKI